MKTFVAALVFAVAPVALFAQAPYRHGLKAGPNATSIPAQDASAKPPVPKSQFVSVTFKTHVVTLSIEDLLNLPQVTVHVHNAHRNADETYTGPLVSDVLAKAGFPASSDDHHLVLHSSVVATGTDKYFVVYSAAEMEPATSTGKVIVAVMKSGLPDDDGGGIQIINTTDTKPARWVQGLSNLNIISVTPAS
jgi:hypothetical protein